MSAASPIAFWHDAVVAEALVDIVRSIGLDDALTASATLHELSGQLGVATQRLSVLVDALEAVGAAEQDVDGRWRATPLLGDLETIRHALVPKLDDTIGVELADRSSAFYPGVVSRLGDWHRASAHKVAEHLGRPNMDVLDAGAGSAVWSLAIAEAFADVRVVAVDLPDVIPTTEEIVSDAGSAPSYRFIGGDLFTSGLERFGCFDLVLAGNLCHLFSAERVATLLHRLAAAVRPGGTLAVIDAIPTGQLDAYDRAARLYGVHLLSRTGEGRPWALSAYEHWFSEIGLVEVAHLCVAEDSPMTVITGRRSGADHT